MAAVLIVNLLPDVTLAPIKGDLERHVFGVTVVLIGQWASITIFSILLVLILTECRRKLRSK